MLGVRAAPTPQGEHPVHRRLPAREILDWIRAVPRCRPPGLGLAGLALPFFPCQIGWERTAAVGSYPCRWRHRARRIATAKDHENAARATKVAHHIGGSCRISCSRAATLSCCCPSGTASGRRASAKSANRNFCCRSSARAQGTGKRLRVGQASNDAIGLAEGTPVTEEQRVQ